MDQSTILTAAEKRYIGFETDIEKAAHIAKRDHQTVDQVRHSIWTSIEGELRGMRMVCLTAERNNEDTLATRNRLQYLSDAAFNLVFNHPESTRPA